MYLRRWQHHDRRVLGLGTAHYPENLHKAYIIGVPSFFSVGWKVISPGACASVHWQAGGIQPLISDWREMSHHGSMTRYADCLLCLALSTSS